MTEQEARAKIDYTPRIIQQSMDLLAADPELSHYPITVDGFKNDMWVRGEVATEAQRERAARLVWTARGVRSVDNQIVVQKR